MDRQQQESGAHLLTLDSPAARVAWRDPASLMLAGVGLLAPGFSSWTEAEGVLTGLAAYRDRGLPPLERLRLSANESRRISLSVRIALQVAEEALAAAAIPAASTVGVFSCSGGNTQSLHKVLDSIAEGTVSPNQFAQMGHHAAGGGWSIASGSPAPTISIGAFDGSFAAGLLEVGCQTLSEDRRPALLVAHDVPPPPALATARPVGSTFAVALVLARGQSSGPIGQLHLHLARRREETRLADPALEALRLHNPAARALPLLRLIAGGEAGQVVLPYLNGLRLGVRYTPC